MSNFSQQYPHLAWWIDNHGYIELGSDYNSSSLLRILDEGGMCFEDSESTDIDEALTAGEEFLETELSDRFSIKLNRKTGDFEEDE